jgi:hypothetical protein
MSSAGGFAFGTHDATAWRLAGDRRLLIERPDVSVRGSALPVGEPAPTFERISPLPGSAAALDVYVSGSRLWAVLDDATVWSMNRRHLSPIWTPTTTVFANGGDMDAQPLLVAAGFARRARSGEATALYLWFVGRDRRLAWLEFETYARGSVDVPVPGDARVIGGDPFTRSVLLESGEMATWSPRGWRLEPLLVDASDVTSSTSGSMT